MSTAKVAITIDQDILAKLDRLVKRNVFASRSQAIQEAISDKLEQVERSRFARESAKSDQEFEKALAEEDLSQEPQVRDEGGEQIAARRKDRFTSEDVHRALFSKPPKRRTLAEMKEGIRRHVKERHARG